MVSTQILYFRHMKQEIAFGIPEKKAGVDMNPPRGLRELFVVKRLVN